MNEKEVGELRRRLRPEKNSITHIRGCYVNEMGESVAPCCTVCWWPGC